MSQNGAGKKQEQFQETLYFTLISPETLGKFRHSRPKKELWNTSWTVDGLYDQFKILCVKIKTI